MSKILATAGERKLDKQKTIQLILLESSNICESLAFDVTFLFERLLLKIKRNNADNLFLFLLTFFKIASANSMIDEICNIAKFLNSQKMDSKA